MRRTLFKFLLAATLGAGATMPAAAGGDLVYSSGASPYPAYGAAIPVPAPIPVPVYEAAWYFRGDLAAGFGPQPSVTTAGAPYGTGPALHTIGLNSAWLSESFQPSFIGGIGVGYVWGPRLRTDFTVDIHSISQATFNGAQNYGAGTVSVQDKTSFLSTILLLNAYYDIRTGTPFTPYIGGGLGFTINALSREIAATDAGTTITASGSVNDVQFAAAAMAGITWELSSFTAIDVNYRFLHIGGSGTNVTINNANSAVSIGDVNEHQIRGGFRFYIN